MSDFRPSCEEIAATVVICTRNRAESLRLTLECLTRMEVPSDVDWELLIVDNGSSDATPHVVDEFVTRLPARRIEEPNAGLSNARNRGVSEAAGRYVVWTDDDVDVDEGWLFAYLNAFRTHTEAVVFGGRSIPRLAPPSVAWFAAGAPYLGDLLAVRDFGPNVIALSCVGDRIPFGLNFAVRTDVQRKFLYDPELGVAPGRRRSGGGDRRHHTHTQERVGGRVGSRCDRISPYPNRASDTRLCFHLLPQRR